MKFVHAADLHLDSPLRGLSRHASAPLDRDRVRMASRRALSNLVELCVQERAGLLVIAGDIYDGDWRDYSTGLCFAHHMSRLREAGVQVVMIRGNHDAASQITKSLRLPDNVRELSFRNPETLCFENLGVAVHGQSFATRAVVENLAQSYPERVPLLLNLGLLHTSVTGRPGHEAYAPCSLDTLKSKGYDYWALGHVHAREVLCEDPWVVFPGNLQGRHAREVGAKGATLVSYDERGVYAVEARALDDVRFAVCDLDLSGVTLFDAALEHVRDTLTTQFARSEGRVLGVRLALHGVTPLHAKLLTDDALMENARAIALDLAGDQLWLEKLVVNTRATASRTELRQGDGPIAALLSALEQGRHDSAQLLELAQELAELRNKLPSELRDGEDGLRLDDPGFIATQLEAVEQLLISRLLPESHEA